MVTVRAGEVADRPILRGIQAAALAEPWPAILDLAAGEGGPRLLVVDDGGPVGYAVAVTASHPDAYVPELAIHPDRQGAGLGSRLLEALLADLAEAGFERVRLTARADDEAVLAFYRGHGFAVVERVADHFDHGDGVVMERTVAEEA